MSEEKALLKAIWEHPLEDAARLVYADWLQETGDPARVARAEFIRLQCERARLDEWDDAERIEKLKARAAELSQLHRKAWMEGVPKALLHATMRRGFLAPQRQRHTGAKFLELRAVSFKAAPLWNFSLTGLYRNFDRVFASPLLLRAGVLMIDLFKYPHDALAKLAGNDHLWNVENLELKSGYHRPGSVTAFFDGPGAAALTHLRFGSTVTRAAVAALGETRTAARLQSLTLYMGPADPVDGALFSAARFPNLRALDLGASAQVTGGGWEAGEIATILTAAPNTRLRRLGLGGCYLGDPGLKALAEWPGLAHLRWLDVTRASGTAVGYRALASSPFTENLKHLYVDDYRLRDLPKVKAELDARFGPRINYG
jgi:uncharacterized protein (TIGR02996 family)